MNSSQAPVGLIARDPFRHARAEAYETLDASNPGLDFAASVACVESQIAASSRAWSSVKEEVMGEEMSSSFDRIVSAKANSCYLKNLPVAFAFGYFLGSQITRMLGGDSAQAEEGGICAALFNSFASLFDKLLDNYPELYPRLMQVSTSEAILESVTSGPSGYWEASVENETHFGLKILSRFMGSYFKRCQSLLSAERDEKVVQMFRTTMIAAYDGELRSKDCLIYSNLRFDEVHDILFAKSVLPSHLVFLTSLMVASAIRKVDLPGWEDVATKLGLAVWIADDISDLGRDLHASRWNYVWLLLARDRGANVFGPDYRSPQAAELDRELVSTGIIAEAVTTAVTGFTQSMRWLEEN
ncbi:MAG: hypothetical protein WA867_10215, partial [Candidatus Acidiferrales bacterium]